MSNDASDSASLRELQSLYSSHSATTLLRGDIPGASSASDSAVRLEDVALTTLRSRYGDSGSHSFSSHSSATPCSSPELADAEAPREDIAQHDSTPGGGDTECSPKYRLRTALRAAWKASIMRKYSMPFGELNMSELMHACAAGNLARVQLRVKEIRMESEERLQDELTVVDDWAGSTPLHWAAYSGNAQIVQLLLQVGAKVNEKNRRDGSMPIHLAARYGRRAALVVLADHPDGRMSINAPNRVGNRPLHECAYEGKAENAEVLITRRAYLEVTNSRDKGGLTPLLSAIEYGHVSVVRVLLRAGADVRTTPQNLDALQARPHHSNTVRSLDRSLMKRRSLPSGISRASSRMHLPVARGAGTGLSKWDVQGEGAISLALATLHLDVVYELLMARMRSGAGPPIVFTAAQLHQITFEVWALERGAEGEVRPTRFSRLFTVLLLCTQPDPPHSTPEDNQAQPGAPTSSTESDLLHTHLSRSGTPLRGVLEDSEQDAEELSQQALSDRSHCAGGSLHADPAIAHTSAPPKEGAVPPTPVRTKSNVSRCSEASSCSSARPPTINPLLLARPQNPVLLALKLASCCSEYARRRTRDRLVNDRLAEAAVLFEHVACGLLHCAAQAAVDAEEKKQVNPWRMGKMLIHPEVARDIFVHDCIEHAAEHELKIFISYPLVFAYLNELFWPKPRLEPKDVVSLSVDFQGASDDQSVLQTGRPVLQSVHSLTLMAREATQDTSLIDGLAYFLKVCGVIALNIISLPMLPFLPASWEAELELVLRKKVTNSQLPIGLVWLLPSGRFFLWLLSTFILAIVITTLPPFPTEFSAWDTVLALYMIGWAHNELQEFFDQVESRQAGWRHYFADPFNALDVLLILGMSVLLCARTLAIITGDEGSNGMALIPIDKVPTWLQSLLFLFEWIDVPTQALSALFAWLRIIQVLFIFPSSGPLLLMAIRMLQDLLQFLTLAGFVVVAFGCAFFVLFRAALIRQSLNDAHATRTSAGNMLSPGDPAFVRSLSIPTVISILVEGALNGESAHLIESIQEGTFGLTDYGHTSTFVWMLMTLFGVAVVLLLLNLLIARFAKTFDILYENVDANFKVAFARVVIEGHNKHLLPPPLNLLRSLILFTYSQLDKLCGSATHCAFDCLKRCAGQWLELCLTKKDSDYEELSGSAAEPELDKDKLTEAEVAKQVALFLRKATDTQVQMLPEGVEQYVLRHQHDIAREERWRTAMQKDISGISLQLSRMRNQEMEALTQHYELLDAIRAAGPAASASIEPLYANNSPWLGSDMPLHAASPRFAPENRCSAKPRPERCERQWSGSSGVSARFDSNCVEGDCQDGCCVSCRSDTSVVRFASAPLLLSENEDEPSPGTSCRMIQHEQLARMEAEVETQEQAERSPDDHLKVNSPVHGDGVDNKAVQEPYQGQHSCERRVLGALDKIGDVTGRGRVGVTNETCGGSLDPDVSREGSSMAASASPLSQL